MNFAVNEFGYLDQKTNDEDVNITCTRSRDSDSSIRSCSIILRQKILNSCSIFRVESIVKSFSEIKIRIEILFKSI